MNPQDPLAALNPLREPPPIGWWPLAPGWWVLLAIAVLAIVAVAWWWWRKRQQSAYRRRALAQLEQLHAQHQATGDNTHFLTNLNALLKRVALLAYPQKNLANIHGAAWITFLNQSAPNQTPFAEALANAHYLPPGSAPKVDGAYRSAQHWIKHHEAQS
ncbi:MAG: DUF4381 domain-containing protein [Halioglobus sp.]